MPTFSTNHSFMELNILKNKYFYIEISYLFLLHLPACVFFAFARTNKDLYDLAYILFFHKKLVNNSFDGIVKKEHLVITVPLA